MSRLLITGFPPFHGRPVNPSALLIETLRLNPAVFPEVELQTALLPVEYAGVGEAADQLLADFRPEIWIAFGVGRQECPIRIERRGQNRDHAEIPDNAGIVRLDQIIEADGPASRKVNVSVENLVQFLKSRGIEAETSDDAGAFICNHLIYHVAKRLDSGEHSCEFVFIHLAPFEFGFPVENLLHALQIIVMWFQNHPESPGEPGKLLATGEQQKGRPHDIS